MNATQRQSKSQQLCANLSQMAQELGPGVRLPSFLELCERLNCSKTSLDTALRLLESRKVIERRHGVGIFVSVPSSVKSLCLICTPMYLETVGASPFWRILLQQAQERAHSKSEDFSVHFSLPAGTKSAPLLRDGLVEDIAQGKVRGVLAVGLDQGTTEWIVEQGVPVVAYAGWAPYMVETRTRDLTDASVPRLKQRGCNRLALWTPLTPSQYQAHGRTAGHNLSIIEDFRRALEAQDLGFDEALVHKRDALLKGSYTEQTHQEQGYQAVMEVFGEAKKNSTVLPDGILINDDMMAYGALFAFMKLGIRVGKDVQIATFINRGSVALLGAQDDVILVEYDVAEIAQAMFDLLEMLTQGETPASEIVTIHPHII